MFRPVIGEKERRSPRSPQPASPQGTRSASFTAFSAKVTRFGDDGAQGGGVSMGRRTHYRRSFSILIEVMKAPIMSFGDDSYFRPMASLATAQTISSGRTWDTTCSTGTLMV